ncbi:MAG: hypothetical protein ABEJ36_00895 [Candidatus Nanosalina sp.]
MEDPDGYALVYGNMVNPENAAGYVQHVSGSEAVEFSEDPGRITLHGEPLQPITLSGYRRSFSHVARDELIADSDLVDAESFEEFMEDEPYEDTENRGFLTIEEDAGSELNAVLVPMTEEDLDFYETAEMGYHLEEVGEGVDAETDLPVHAAVSHTTGNPEPNRSYFRDCLNSWEKWGETTEVDQAQRFLETTQVGGETLYEWASERQLIQDNL